MNGKGHERRPQLERDWIVSARWWLAFKAPRVIKIIVRAVGL